VIKTTRIPPKNNDRVAAKAIAVAVLLLVSFAPLNVLAKESVEKRSNNKKKTLVVMYAEGPTATR
jgi:hypothetical protein